MTQRCKYKMLLSNGRHFLWHIKGKYNMNRIILATGGFDPIHSGHIAYFSEARSLGDQLIIGLNSDSWLTRKKGAPFMPFAERAAIISNLKMVSSVIEFDDSDGSSRDAILKVRSQYPDSRIVFVNGGDRTAKNIPEMSVNDSNVEFVFGVGGDDKKNSSSWILQEWKTPKTVRPWGYYRVLHTPSVNVKVKELTVDPGKSLSMQRHVHRAEVWFVAEGVATVGSADGTRVLDLFKTQTIEPQEWHQLQNNTTAPLKIIEIQYGERCSEEDIERK